MNIKHINMKRVVSFDFLDRIGGIEFFNFGFSIYNSETGKYDDSLNFGYEDDEKVLNTVLNIIQKFIEHHPEAMLLIKGNDHPSAFIYNCQHSCNEERNTDCRTFKSEIGIYSNYLNQYIKELSKEFEFFGGFDDQAGGILIEPYVPGKDYNFILMRKILNDIYAMEENEESEKSVAEDRARLELYQKNLKTKFCFPKQLKRQGKCLERPGS